MKNKIAAIIAFSLFGLGTLYITASIIGSKYDGSAEVEEAREKYDVVLVDFWGEGCKPCRMIAPYIEEIEQEYCNVEVIRVDINSEEGLNKNTTLDTFLL